MAIDVAQRAVISPVNVEARRTLGIKPGDTVRVSQKIEEKGKVRLQIFEGLVLAVKHGREAGATFTVRRVASGVGVEKIFPLYSPMIDKIEIMRRSKVRRSKLYYIREKVAKEIRRQMRNMRIMDLSTGSDIAQKEAKKKEKEKEAEEAEVKAKETEEESVTAEAGSTEEIKEEKSKEELAQEEKSSEEKPKQE